MVKGCRAALLALAACVSSCSETHRKVVTEHQDYLSMLDFAALSNERAVSFVERNFTGQDFRPKTGTERAPPLSLLHSLANQRRATVRIAVQYAGSMTENGSGVFLDKGRHVLSAGHVVHILEQHPDAKIQVTVRGHWGSKLNNRVYDGRLVYKKYEPAEPSLDVCLIEVFQPDDDLPFVETSTFEPGQMLFGYGYPQGIGINHFGRAIYWTDMDHLDPVLIVVRVPQDGNYRFEALAGGRTLGGMSGGPLFDSAGRVVSVITGFTRNITQGEATHLTRTSPIDGAVRYLKEH